MTHGYSDDSLCWTSIAQELTDRYDVFLPVARGHGYSDPNSHNDPTLILKADDQGKLREQNKEVTALLKNGQLVHIEGAGHSVHRDQKQRFIDTLNAFLKKMQ